MRKTSKKKFKKSGIAPLVEVDRNELGDKRLNPEENVVKQREELLSLESKKQLWKQKELEDVERSMGPRINYTDLIRRLQKLNPSIEVKDGCTDDKGVGAVALYIRKKQFEYTPEEIAEPWNCIPPNGVFFLDHRYIGGFQKIELAEWSHVLTNTSEIAVRERRGWRSVLIKLIQSEVITYSQAVKEFGECKWDKRATFWNDALMKYRSN